MGDVVVIGVGWRVVGGPGGDLLSHVLRRSTMGAAGFHGRVRNGIGWGTRAMATRSTQPPPGAAGSAAAAAATRGGGRCWQVLGMGCAVACGCRWMGVEVDRAIRTGKLHALPRFHIRPIDVVVYHGSRWRDLVLRKVSRLDAFSGYPVRT